MTRREQRRANRRHQLALAQERLSAKRREFDNAAAEEERDRLAGELAEARQSVDELLTPGSDRLLPVALLVVLVVGMVMGISTASQVKNLSNSNRDAIEQNHRDLIANCERGNAPGGTRVVLFRALVAASEVSPDPVYRRLEQRMLESVAPVAQPDNPMTRFNEAILQDCSKAFPAPKR